VAAPPPALAESTGNACNYDFVTFNACLRFDDRGFGWWDAQVGIDVYMPEQYAREILACGANFKASLRADDGDGYYGPLISHLVIKPGWPQPADAGGISAEFTVPVLSSQLNEDDDGQDELYASISYVDCHTGWTRRFDTGTIRHYF
jgi:hypothetical protein